MSDGVAPSKGAVRAARLLRSKIHNLDGRGGECTDPNHEANARWLANVSAEDAEIIDRETKSPQMAEALQELMTLILNGSQVYGAKQLQWITQKPVWAKCERLLSELEVKS